MIANRELTIDDYLAMLRRRAKVILIPALLAPLAGYMVSRAFPAKYTSQALILVEAQRVPESMIQPVVSEDLTARIETLHQQVLSPSELRPVVERLGLSKTPQGVDDVIANIGNNMMIEPVPDLTQIGTTSTKKKPAQGSPVPGFFLKYTASNPREAQNICSELTSLMITDNSKRIDAAAAGTSDVLSKGLEDAKSILDDYDAKLAAFKKQHVGQLPGDRDNNVKILMGLNTQLEAHTQALNRAQQDKAYAESLLSQQVAAWKAAQDSTNPQTLQKQLSELQSKLPELQARYTADHPDVIKAKADIAEVKKKLDEINKAAAQAPASTGDDQASANEPAEIQKLRLQVHQYGDAIAASSRNQKRLQEQIAEYQDRVTLSPTVEEEYKLLDRDYENAAGNYQGLLSNKTKADMTAKMNLQQQGERMFPLDPANLPEDPSFPNRLLFAAGGLGAGLVLGVVIALWLELRDKSIRTEADAEAALQLPLLVAVPWIVKGEAGTNGSSGFWRNKQTDEHKETIGA
jgi:polysaccharide chain length determinant protein (PEP-CTERM system associated)